MRLPDPPGLELARGVPATIALARSEDGAAPALATRVELLDDGERLIVAFDCDDPEPRATHRERDAPLWEEEVVELFVAPGPETPRRYFELELNPLGALFDACVDSPFGDRREMRVDRSWDCPGLVGTASARAGGWRARLVLPWSSLAPDGTPELWRVNLFRIDRPTRGAAEFSAWSPTFVAPADFHRPARFGFLRRVG